MSNGHLGVGYKVLVKTWNEDLGFNAYATHPNAKEQVKETAEVVMIVHPK